MAPEIKKAAETYVKSQVSSFSRRVSQRDVKEAIRKVAAVLQEFTDAQVRSARISLK